MCLGVGDLVREVAEEGGVAVEEAKVIKVVDDVGEEGGEVGHGVGQEAGEGALRNVW